MRPKLNKVIANDNYTLTLLYDNGEERIFDVEPYLDKGIFRKLKNTSKFKAVRLIDDTVQWPGGQDFCPDTIYYRSKKLEHA